MPISKKAAFRPAASSSTRVRASTLALAACAVVGGAGAATISGKFTDSQGRTQLIIGQTTDGIYDYTVNSALPTPWGVTMYAAPSLTSGGFTTANGTLSTNVDWYKYGYGPQDLSFIKNTSQLNGAAIAVGYWIGGDYDYDIANGTNLSGDNANNILWSNTQRMITDLKNTGRPILLRIGYEAEAPWNGHWPANYQIVWQKIRNEINAQGATNIATVWQLAANCPATDYWNAGITPRQLIASKPIAATGANSNGVQNVPESNPGSILDQWYPGANADWTGISDFDPEDCADGYGSLQAIVNYLKTKGKPILVAESAARGYDYNPSTGLYTYNQTAKASRPNLTPTQVWNEWYAPFFQFVRQNSDSIRAVAYISDDWQKYTHWACTVDANGNIVSGCAEANWGNTRVDVNPTIKANWMAQLTSDGKYIASTGGTGGGGGGTTDTTPPSVPAGLHVTGTTSSSIALGWTASTDNVGVTRYDVYRGSALAGSATGTSYTDGSLAASTTYSYTVKACDAAGNCSAASSSTSGTTAAAAGGGGGGGTVNVPGTVTSTSFTGAKSFSVNVGTAGAYYFVINYSSTAASKLIVTTFNGSTANAATNAGTGSVQTIDFNSVATGTKTLTITPDSGVTITSVTAYKR